MNQVYLRVRLLFNVARPDAHHPVNLTENARTADVVVSGRVLPPSRIYSRGVDKSNPLSSSSLINPFTTAAFSVLHREDPAPFCAHRNQFQGLQSSAGP